MNRMHNPAVGVGVVGLFGFFKVSLSFLHHYLTMDCKTPGAINCRDKLQTLLQSNSLIASLNQRDV